MYEMLILLGVWGIGYLVPSLILGIMFDIKVPNWLAFGHVYLLFGIYFTWYWKTTGQTLAMQTWRVQLVTQHGDLLKRNQGLIRYAISSLWLIPSICIYGLYQVIFQRSMGHWPTIELLFFTALLFWPMTCLFDKDKTLGPQSFVDKITQTRLIQLPKKNTNSATTE